ncbi:type VI secretion system membrane subunit TssM [Burkholderia sp. Nafp2/4-1b]|uniref:type VI secretion system membrane subunit TssM n=1 Tax=Burkholderia sp. Nafp2/4-1b TaxID=2116686 RepID=UPI000EF96679|nr:type VI secretion system membrane subunit TssM [Burkholderia sp. Nafp2/4-1b]RKT99180.1 type VI secretion system membrane subunit TssM [Burkholderia sp. Nafp2/4-1b]
MKKFQFLSFLASRQFLAFLALIVVALVIWFVGPFFAFGGLKPLAAAGMRVLLIALLLAGVLLWLVGQSTIIVFVALLCLLIWYAGPLLSFGHMAPLEPVSTRLTAIAVVVGVLLIFGMYRVWQRMRADDAFLKKMLRKGDKKDESPAASRLREIEPILTSALARLKAMRTGARGLGRLFQGKRYLYELPWYITLGSRGSGKTSVLMNGGLAFPVAEQMQRAAGKPVADAASVDWWLTNDAVLIDTAGYYTRHGTSPTADVDEPTPATNTVGVDTRDSKPDEKRAEDDPKQDTSTQSKVVTASKSSADSAPSRSAQRHGRQDIDRAEWLGFLGMLRRNRPRAPINGALLTIDLATLASADEQARIAEAAALRARLAELRQELGIRFPVYVMVTKVDGLTGFSEYFGTLTSEGRAQTWGFTLPYGKETVAKEGLRAHCHHELTRLSERLSESIDTHLQDEYDLLKRRKLAALPEEFSALLGPLTDLIDRVFLDSRYDDTQLHATLRGVYFTSARQWGGEVVAERHTLVQRLLSGQDHAAVSPQRAEGNRSFFLHDLLTRVVFPEAHLVSPNLRWEFRYRLLRLIGHTLTLLLFVWLMIGLRVSFGHNSDYLDAMGRKAQALTARVTQLYKTPKLEAVPDTLTEARYLPTFPHLDISDPGSEWRYALYVPSSIATESGRTYDALEDNLLLPQIVGRMEDVMSGAIAGNDSKAAYDALRVYLMLYDAAKFNAGDVKTWVLDDWAKNDSAAVFGGRASMVDHVQQLFSGDRVVKSPRIRNDALIQRTRAFLDGSNATGRLYERAKAAMQKEAPDEFTLLRAVGPQAGTVFTRASDAPLSRGVSGLFTFDGYRNLFDKRLPEFVQIARDDDAWVMGRSYLAGTADSAQKKTAEIVTHATGMDDALTDAVRREYLTEYAQQWDAFLNDIRTVSGTSLAFNLQVLRRFAAPDSPLVRLARAAVHETTLTAPVSGSGGTFLQKAADQINQKADKALGIRASERVERDIVDAHFAALREVVTGNADSEGASQAASHGGGATGLDGVTNLLNDYYTALTVSDNALSNNSMPPASDAAAKLKMAANTMPAPFRAVLLQLAADSSREVNQGIGQLLSRQMQATVGDTCRLTIDGNYPFSPDSKRDVGIDDFTRVFAQGGVIDDFFVKTLSPFVDTSAKPWRYRTLPGATEPVQGPDLEPFEHAKAIRDVFFNDPGHKQLTWKADIRIPELDPAIMGLSLDVDGQSSLYQHGPVAPFTVSWPGPRGGVHAEITANPRIRPETSTIAADGPWALMRLLQRGRVVETATPGRTRVAFDFDGRKAALDIASTGSVANPLTSDVLRTFRCPSSMPLFSLSDSGPPPGLPRGMLPASPVNTAQ